MLIIVDGIKPALLTSKFKNIMKNIYQHSRIYAPLTKAVKGYMCCPTCRVTC